MSLPPWALLRAKQSKAPIETTESRDHLEPNAAWVPPVYLQLEKHARYYRDLMKSTEKVELSLAHSGKDEVFDSFDDPLDPPRAPPSERVQTVLVPIRSDMDPRMSFDDGRRCVGTYPEYCDPTYLRDLLDKRAAACTATPLGSKTATPQGSPRQSPVGMMSSSSSFRPPPPPMGARPPPPPSRAPGFPAAIDTVMKKARLMDY